MDTGILSGFHRLKFSGSRGSCGSVSNVSLSSCPPADGCRVRLLRYVDPELGPRQMPVFGDPSAGKEPLGDDVTFHIDTAARRVTCRRGGEPLPIGDQLVYIVAAA